MTPYTMNDNDTLLTAGEYMSKYIPPKFMDST